MFDGGGAGGFDMSDLLAQAQAMQNQLMEAQADLESQEIEGSAGGGLVTALVSGTGELLSLTIKPEAVDPDDTETLADLVVAAVRDASENAKEVAARAMGPLAGGLPGFGRRAGFGGGFGGAGGSPGPVHPERRAVKHGRFDEPRSRPVKRTRPGQGRSRRPESGGTGFVNPGDGTGQPGQNPG